MPDGGALLPFVLEFLRTSFHTFVKNEERLVHEIPQGEGGEQGNPLTPALFALGQHGALEAIQESLQPFETLTTFFDDVYVTRAHGHGGAVGESQPLESREDPSESGEDTGLERGEAFRLRRLVLQN